MTTLMEELRLAVQEILQSIGLGGSANTATVVPVLMLGIALNVIALGVVDRVHPIKEKARVVDAARVEFMHVQSLTVCVLRQIEGRKKGWCSAKLWTSCRVAERVKCRVATGLDRLSSRNRRGSAFPCSYRSYPNGARKTLQAI
jgi:hypothetical protein